jgi:signal transduction histidine kinase
MSVQCAQKGGSRPVPRHAAGEEAGRRAERQRLARDLRDTVSQTLLSLHWTAQAAADLWDVQPAQARTAL